MIRDKSCQSRIKQTKMSIRDYILCHLDFEEILKIMREFLVKSRNEIATFKKKQTILFLYYEFPLLCNFEIISLKI
jgi:hypothetical protein